MNYKDLLEVKREGFYTFVNRHCNSDTAEVVKLFADMISARVSPEDYQAAIDGVVQDLDDAIESIAERYCTSYPISGKWETELAHERKALMNELEISKEDANWILINLLGFSREEVSK